VGVQDSGGASLTQIMDIGDAIIEILGKAEAIKLPGWAKCILEAKVAAAEMLEDEEEVSVDEPKPVMAN